MRNKIIVLVVLVMFLCASFSFAQQVSGKKFYTPEEVNRKVRDLESLNLIKALNLSKDQMLKLLDLLYEARLQEREVFEGYKKDSAHAIKMLEMLEKKIMEGKGVDVDTEEKVWFALGTLYEYEYDQYMMMNKLVEKTKEILNANQLRIISEYMPCVIPWASVKPTARIGQAGSIAKLEKILDRLRKLKGEEYLREKRRYLVELDWRLRIDRHEDDRARQIWVRQVDEKIDKIHNMSEEEYQIRKTDLAQSIKPPDLEILPPRVGEELNEYIEEYVLNPHNIPYIQYQLKKMGVKYPEPDDIIDEDIDKDVD